MLATGLSGEAYLPSHIEGLDDFKGDRLLHSSQFSGPEQNADSKKAVVVGSSNSAHDIAKDYYDHGYDVTMVQRSSTLVVTSQTLIDVTMKGLYAEDGVYQFIFCDAFSSSHCSSLISLTHNSPQLKTPT